MTSSGVFVSLFGDIGSTAYGVYDLVSGSWRPASPDIGQFDVAVWTGRYVFTFGAVQWTNGGLFDPLTGTWQIANVADSAIQSSAVWAGSEVILWGGLHWGTYTARDRGWRYSPSLDSSVPVGMGSTPEGRTLHSAIWTGNEMIVWGGFRDWIGDGMQGRPIDTGGYYFPAANAWTPSSMIGAPTPRDSHTAVWTGTRMAVWGGNGTARAVQIFDSCYGSDFGDAGALLDPLNNSWSPMSSQSAPPARAAHSAVWTGVEMVVWGGCNRFGEEQTGGRYNPVSDHWMPTSVENAPTSRIRHSAVWTGQEMIVWGGGTENAGGTPRGGARYSPSLDSWHPVSGIDAASTSGTPAVIWSGRNMYVWNGPSQASGRYDPTLDSWQPLQTTGAPTRTARRRGVWTGREMLVEAGRYDAAFDSWRSKSIANEARVGDWSTSVWTGQEEIVWGGFIDGCEAVSTGGAYCAATPLPIADAGPDQLVECTSPEGAIAHLDGSRSSDPESLPLSFRWFAPVPLDNLFSATPTGQFPLGSTSARLTVSTAGGLSAEDDTVIVVRDSTPPTGHVLFPARGACFGPAAIPLTVRDDFADSCDPSFTKTYDPPGGPIYRDHGDYTLNVSASDQSGNVGTASTNFTIDLIAPQVTTFQPSTQVAVPGLVPFSELFAASDSDGASGEVVHESAYVNGCLAFDGSTYGDHDGLLEDDNLTADLPTLCSIMKRCGLPSLGNVSLRFEAADCGGNVGMATRELSFVPAVTPRTCDIQLLLSHEEGGASLTWSPLDGAKSFDLIRGEVAQLGSRGNQVDLGVVTCLATRTGHMTHADGIAPLAGTAYFYLVRSTSEQGPESYGSSSEGTLRVPAAGDCTM